MPQIFSRGIDSDRLSGDHGGMSYHPWRRSTPWPLVLRQPRPAGWTAVEEATTVLALVCEGRTSLASTLTIKEDGARFSDPVSLPTPAPLGPGDLLFANGRAGLIIRPGYYQTARLPGAGPWRRVAACVVPLNCRMAAEYIAKVQLPEKGVVYVCAAPLKTADDAWSSFRAITEQVRKFLHWSFPADLPCLNSPSWKE